MTPERVARIRALWDDERSNIMRLFRHSPRVHTLLWPARHIPLVTAAPLGPVNDPVVEEITFAYETRVMSPLEALRGQVEYRIVCEGIVLEQDIRH